MAIDFGQIRANYPLPDIAARYLPDLKKRGNEYSAKCIWHDDRNPSLNIFFGSDGIWHYKCFSCGVSGDVLDFVAGAENVDTAEAAKRLDGNQMPATPVSYQGASKPVDEAGDWTPILPVPDDAPKYDPATTFNPKRSEVVRYRPVRQDAVLDADGRLLGYVVRLDIAGGKLCITVTYCEGPSGRRWCAKRFPRPTPLVGLDQLAKHPGRAVLICEGEKCRQVGAENLPGFVTVCWIGGTNAVEHADLEPLRGRAATLWPDNDEPGRLAMATLAERVALGSVRHIDTAGLPEGYDIADLVESGVTGQALLDWCKARVRPGAPVAARPESPASPPQIKNPLQAVKPEAGQVPVAGRVQEPGRTAQANGSKPPASVSTAPPRASAPASNVVALRRPEPEEDFGIPPKFSDVELARRFSEKYADSLLYVEAWKRWQIWTGDHWKPDETLLARDLAKGLAVSVSGEAFNDFELTKSKQNSIATAISSARTVSNIESLARGDRRHAATADQWDQDLWTLNTPGGVVDLRSGDLRPARRTDYVTKITKAAPGGNCPVWLDFLRVVAGDKPGLIEFMQRMAGYCLTGVTQNHAIFFVYGEGGNGKSTFLETLGWLLNDYADTASMEMFIKQKFNSDQSSVAGLRGARLVTAQETEAGKAWNEQRLTEFTGGTPLTACFKYANPFTFMPQFKLVFAGNHKPELRNINEAIRRRLHMIPFTVTVPPEKRDPYLPEKLRAEAGGILQWCIDGCLEWQRIGLAPPACVLATTEEYFSSEDTLGQFLEETCDYGSTYHAPTGPLYEKYCRWSEQVGENYTLPRKNFLSKLESKGFKRRKTNGQYVVDGIRLREEYPDRPYRMEG